MNHQEGSFFAQNHVNYLQNMHLMHQRYRNYFQPTYHPFAPVPPPAYNAFRPQIQPSYASYVPPAPSSIPPIAPIPLRPAPVASPPPPPSNKKDQPKEKTKLGVSKKSKNISKKQKSKLSVENCIDITTKSSPLTSDVTETPEFQNIASTSGQQMDSISGQEERNFTYEHSKNNDPEMFPFESYVSKLKAQVELFKATTATEDVVEENSGPLFDEPTSSIEEKPISEASVVLNSDNMSNLSQTESVTPPNNMVPTNLEPYSDNPHCSTYLQQEPPKGVAIWNPISQYISSFSQLSPVTPPPADHTVKTNSENFSDNPSSSVYHQKNSSFGLPVVPNSDYMSNFGQTTFVTPSDNIVRTNSETFSDKPMSSTNLQQKPPSGIPNYPNSEYFSTFSPPSSISPPPDEHTVRTNSEPMSTCYLQQNLVNENQVVPNSDYISNFGKTPTVTPSENNVSTNLETLSDKQSGLNNLQQNLAYTMPVVPNSDYMSTFGQTASIPFSDEPTSSNYYQQNPTYGVSVVPNSDYISNFRQTASVTPPNCTNSETLSDKQTGSSSLQQKPNKEMIVDPNSDYMSNFRRNASVTPPKLKQNRHNETKVDPNSDPKNTANSNSESYSDKATNSIYLQQKSTKEMPVDSNSDFISNSKQNASVTPAKDIVETTNMNSEFVSMHEQHPQEEIDEYKDYISKLKSLVATATDSENDNVQTDATIGANVKRKTAPKYSIKPGQR